MNTLVKIIIGDITKQKVDCIVNGTNSNFYEGGSVHNAILNVAGPKLKEELEKLGIAKTGDAKITDGFNLPSKKIIHTVIPTWINGHSNEEDDLATCYKNVLEVALKNHIKTLSIPVLGTGLFKFPKEISIRVALQTIRRLTNHLEAIDEVHLVAFDQESFDIFKKYF